MARLLSIARRTVERKVRFLGLDARARLKAYHRGFPKCQSIEFDDVETFEHTKLKPLSITLAVETKTRRILGFAVSPMPAHGRLSERAKRKYGPRRDERKRGRERLFKSLQGLVNEKAEIRSDQNPHYPEDVKRFFPKATHIAFKGRKPRDQGQGELKEGVYDPLFSLNHTAAMLRYGIANLIRKTWCTTKRAERLKDRLSIYALYHNLELI